MKNEKNEATRRRKTVRRVPRRSPAAESAPRMHPITFCTGCGEAIPAQALTCFRCGAKQPTADKPLQVVFCDKCGKDYPARAMACYHCGHQNLRHPFHKGHVTA